MADVEAAWATSADVGGGATGEEGGSQGGSQEGGRGESIRQEINGYTWPGIEHGEPPAPTYPYICYLAALRKGNLSLFREIERIDSEWYFPTLDRGAGSPLHAAASAGRLEVVRFLLSERATEINQQDRTRGLTPLHNVAARAHDTTRPYLELFDHLLENGADPNIEGDRGETVLEAAVEKGRGWKKGEVRNLLAASIEQHSGVEKKRAYRYNGPRIGREASEVIAAWNLSPKIEPASNWIPPPEPGEGGSQGMRRVTTDEGWRPSGTRVRKLTQREMEEQEKEADGFVVLDENGDVL